MYLPITDLMLDKSEAWGMQDYVNAIYFFPPLPPLPCSFPAEK